MRFVFSFASLVLVSSIAASARADDVPAAPPPAPPPAPAPAPAPERRLSPWPAPAPAAPPPKSPDDQMFLHGFRIGYGYVMSYDQPSPSLDGKSLKERADLRTPSHFLLGYEVLTRIVGHSWLNVILIANGMIAGLEQSRLLPTGNFLIGAELRNSFQIGVGASLSPLKGYEAHTIVAAGWTPRVGSIYTPVHFFFIPDVDGVHRMGVTTGVTF